MDRGRLIVFEGLDGSGKSTQIRMLARRLEEQGRPVVRTAEPTDLPTGKLLRQELAGSGEVSAAYLAGLFLADRIAHNTDAGSGIQALLDRGVDVISDRYYYSSFAYQGLDTDPAWVMEMNLNCPDIRKPDLCIFLDVDQRVCKERIDQRGERPEIYERDVAKLEAIRGRFLEVFRLLEGKETVRIVDAGRPPEEIAEEVFRLVDGL